MGKDIDKERLNDTPKVTLLVRIYLSEKMKIKSSKIQKLIF